MQQSALTNAVVQLSVILCTLCTIRDARCKVQGGDLVTHNPTLGGLFEEEPHNQQLSDLPGGEKDHGVSMTKSKERSLTCSEDSSCPPWFFCSTNGACTCGRSHQGLVKCNGNLSSILDCYCVTTNSQNRTVLGACFYHCTKVRKDFVYHPLPRDPRDLNDHMCRRFNRTGQLCGKCEPDLYLPVYSFDLKCVPCQEGNKNWWKFIFAAFVPLTFFYFFVLFFKINANSSHLHGFVFYSQIVTIPAFCRILLQGVVNYPQPYTLMRVGLALFGFWNLDFFRSLMPETLCLHTDTLQTLALDYAIAIYPLLLMIISYALIELHDRNFTIVVQIWKPFRFIFTFFRRNWDSRTSVIDAYATFFLLSFIKFLSVSFDLLIPTHLYELNSNKTTFVLYYDGSVEYFGKEHLPYALLALTVMLFFVFLPTALLLLYPFRWFQRFLNCFPIRWHILHTFVDSFQGCYKDGTEPGTRDCRWFAALFLIIRIIGFGIFMGTRGSAYFEYAILILLVFIVLLVIVQPFKHEVAHYTKINMAFVTFVILLYTSLAGYDIASVKERWLVVSFYVLAVIFGFIPLFYMSCISVHWLISRRKWSRQFIQRVRAWRQGYSWWELEEEFESSLPDRIINPRQYHEGNLSNFPTHSSSVKHSCSIQSIATY